MASGGQSLISQATAAVIHDRLPAGAGLHDLGEHRLKDLVRPERVFQLGAPDLPADFPRLKSLNASLRAHNLPVQLTSFVGRETEIAEARHLLAETHLLTLTGPGGTGKTRLSLQVAAEALPEYAHGAWLVELAPLGDPAYLVPALAAVLEVREQPGRPQLDGVTDYLRAKHLLLLDNCEHLIDACARLADGLLHACPGLKLLASSREALSVAGETAYRVPSLALPEVQAATPASLARSEAAQPRFTLTERNAPAVAAICRRLDGIPLALELAAARVRVLSVEQILARLDDRFRLLVGGSRSALKANARSEWLQYQPQPNGPRAAPARPPRRGRGGLRRNHARLARAGPPRGRGVRVGVSGLHRDGGRASRTRGPTVRRGRSPAGTARLVHDGHGAPRLQ